MNLKGLFGNKIATPQWKNKDGVNEFDGVLNTLANIGKKILNKRAGEFGLEPNDTVVTTEMVADSTGLNKEPGTKGQVTEVRPEYVKVILQGDQASTTLKPNQVKKAALKFADEQPTAETPKEQEVAPAAYYDAAPRSLGESFHNRGAMGDRAIMKAREIVGKELEKLDMPAVDVMYLKSDISRYDGNGIPATGRISFQMPIMTAQGDTRVIYADVDIILGGLMPPKYFTDGINQKYAFDKEGVGQLLSGRDFEVMQNPKVAPETVYFETPGHLAGRGSMGLTKYAEEPKPAEERPVEVSTGTDVAGALTMLEHLQKDLETKKKELVDSQKKLQEMVKDTEEAAAVRESIKKVEEIKKQEEDLLKKISNIFDQFQTKTVEYQKILWKIEEREEKGRQPVFTAVAGALIDKLKSTIPTIETLVNEMWDSMRVITTTKVLTRIEPEGQEPTEWPIEEKKKTPSSTFVPPREEKKKKEREDLLGPPTTLGGSGKGMQKKASISEDIAKIFALFGEIDEVAEQAK